MPAANIADGPYPIAPPAVAGNVITVDLWLRDPTRVQRSIEDITNLRFVADVIFGQGPAIPSGSVIFDQIVEQGQIFLAGDVQEIEPGADFPILNALEAGPLVAIARKYGGEVFLTYEDVRRDRRDKLGRRLTQLRNTIVRKVDRIAMAALRAAPIIQQNASGDWSTAATDIVRDIAVAKNAITRLELGYAPDTVLIHDDQELDLLSDKDIRDAMPRERDNSLIKTGNVGRILGLDFIATSQVNAGEVFVLQRKVAGSISDEVPLYARPIDEPRQERTYVHGARLPAVYVTDPKAVVRITGA
jgi:hypothetical protein